MYLEIDDLTKEKAILYLMREVPRKNLSEYLSFITELPDDHKAEL